MINIQQIFEYLKKKNPNFKKTSSKGKILFTCPKEEEHRIKTSNPTCTVISGSDKLYCLACGFKGTVYDYMRVFEKKPQLSEADIVSLLTNETKIDIYSELEEYKKYGWSLLPIATNGKIPLEKDWTNKTHYEKTDWIKWLEQGFNIGVRSGEVSGITLIDADLKEAPNKEYEEIYKMLTEAKTLTQNSPKGKHFVFKYDKDIKQTVKIAGITIDIRNDGGQFLVAPSKINTSSYHWINLGGEIKSIPEELKNKLLSTNKVDRVETSKEDKKTIETVKQIPEGGRNDLLVSIGGIFIKAGISPNIVKTFLEVINQKFMSPPLPNFEINAMVGSLDGYKQSEEETQEQYIYEACQLIQSDISAKDIMEHTGLKRAIVDKYLAKFHKEGKLARRGRGRYDLRAKVEWVNEEIERGREYEYKMPYFDDVAYFRHGDIVLIGSPTGHGKTHIAMNIIKQMKEQGITPFYISLESGSRYEKIAHQLGLTIKDFYVSKNPIDNPLQIEIEPNSFTIIDWLYTGDDFAATQSVFKHLNDEMVRKGGVLVVFTQLKENYDWFAVNLVKSFPRLAARFVYDDDKGLVSHFDVGKITDPKGHYQTARVNCEFDFDTKELKKTNGID